MNENIFAKFMFSVSRWIKEGVIIFKCRQLVADTLGTEIKRLSDVQFATCMSHMQITGCSCKIVTHAYCSIFYLFYLRNYDKRLLWLCFYAVYNWF